MKNKLPLILLVDDDDDDNFFHRHRIMKAEVAERVEVCTDGEEAMDYLEKAFDTNQPALPDLIFLDINMPRMDGWEFLEQYRRFTNSPRDIPVIVMLSTSENTADVDRARSYPAVREYQVKPLTEDKLRTILEKYF